MPFRPVRNRPPAGPPVALASALFEVGRFFLRTSPRDLSLTAFSTLATLADVGPHRITTLAEKEGISQPSMSNLTKGLERAGMVTRTRDLQDARAVVVSATDKGTKVIRRRREYRANQFAELLSELEEHDLLKLASAIPALHKLIEIANAKLDRNLLNNHA